MKTAINEQLTVALFYLNRDYFFEEINEKLDKNKAKKLGIEPTIVILKDGFFFYAYKGFTLKKEFHSILGTASLSEAVQYMHIPKINELSKKVRAINGWVTFLGILAIISMVVSIIMIIGVSSGGHY